MTEERISRSDEGSSTEERKVYSVVYVYGKRSALRKYIYISLFKARKERSIVSVASPLFQFYV